VSSALSETAVAYEKATPGLWSWNCAGEIFVDIDGESIRIGHFQGCEADAESVCQLHNNATVLLNAATAHLAETPA
jgi:hypothetical protein